MIFFNPSVEAPILFASLMTRTHNLRIESDVCSKGKQHFTDYYCIHTARGGIFGPSTVQVSLAFSSEDHLSKNCNSKALKNDKKYVHYQNDFLFIPKKNLPISPQPQL